MSEMLDKLRQTLLKLRLFRDPRAAYQISFQVDALRLLLCWLVIFLLPDPVCWSACGKEIIFFFAYVMKVQGVVEKEVRSRTPAEELFCGVLLLHSLYDMKELTGRRKATFSVSVTAVSQTSFALVKTVFVWRNKGRRGGGRKVVFKAQMFFHLWGSLDSMV